VSRSPQLAAAARPPSDEIENPTSLDNARQTIDFPGKLAKAQE